MILINVESLSGLNNCFYVYLLDDRPLSPLPKRPAMVKCNEIFVFPFANVFCVKEYICLLQGGKTRY